MTSAKELGLSEAEYRDAMALEKLYSLIRGALKDHCQSCERSGITHVDLRSRNLICAYCVPKGKLPHIKQIGSFKVTADLVDELERKFGERRRPQTENEEEFNVWWAMPKQPAAFKEKQPVSLPETPQIEDEDIPGMIGVIKQIKPRGGLSSEEQPFLSVNNQWGSRPTSAILSSSLQEDLTRTLNDISRKQLQLSEEINRLSTRLTELFGRSSTTPPPIELAAAELDCDKRLLDPNFSSSPPPTWTKNTKRNPFRNNQNPFT